MKCYCYILMCCLLCLLLGACSSLGLTNEDAGHSILASDVSVPANGSVMYTIDRNPRTGATARQWSKDNNVSRSMFSWFGFGGKQSTTGGSVRTHGGRPDGS